jgi:hypothetical protein
VHRLGLCWPGRVISDVVLVTMLGLQTVTMVILDTCWSRDSCHLFIYLPYARTGSIRVRYIKRRVGVRDGLKKKVTDKISYSSYCIIHFGPNEQGL